MLVITAERNNLMITLYKEALSAIENLDPDRMPSLADAHVKGLYSIVLAGKKSGELLRVFVSTVKISPYELQFHTHRYNISIAVIKGVVVNHVAESGTFINNSVKMDVMKYNSPLVGEPCLTTVADNATFRISEYTIPHDAELYMEHNLFHTISCDAGGVWIVKEQGIQADESYVLGRPFSTAGLYREIDPDINTHLMNELHILIKNKGI